MCNSFKKALPGGEHLNYFFFLFTQTNSHTFIMSYTKFHKFLNINFVFNDFKIGKFNFGYPVYSHHEYNMPAENNS